MKPHRGMTLIDALVGSALILIVFLGLVGLLRASALVSAVSKAKAGATAVADTQMEYIRSLSYDSVGTVGGIPAGNIPQATSTTMNGITYSIRTFIAYVDDPADGTGASDSNGVTTDYKVIKIAVTYPIKRDTREVDLVSNYAPPSIETTTGGGTLKVAVVGATGSPIPGASVRVQNSSTSPTVDVTTFSDSDGIVYLGGAATSTQYRITVSKNGYSTAQTYARDATNQNPTPGYLTVVQNQTTTGTFAIDQLASFVIRTLYPISASSTFDTFADTAHLANQNNTSVSGGVLSLAQGAGGYPLTGSARSTAVTPDYLAAWTNASSTLSVPAGTNALIHITNGTSTLIPDSVLPGNSAGFSAFPIDLSGVSTTTYPSLGLSAELATNATTTTPYILDWKLNYSVGPIPVPNVSFSLIGHKTIGTTGAGSPIYKTAISTSTDATGLRSLSLEWDNYDLSLSGYDTVDACSASPYTVSPGASYDNSIYLAAATSNSLLVSVRDGTGALVPGASVTLSRTGYSGTETSSSCGAAYFGGLASASDYSITITKSGYTNTSYSSVPVSGHTFYATAFP